MISKKLNTFVKILITIALVINLNSCVELFGRGPSNGPGQSQGQGQQGHGGGGQGPGQGPGQGQH